jgi:hypothetical protein
MLVLIPLSEHFMNEKTLVLSIALNGYQWMYKTEINSHKKYAENNGYAYQAVTKPYITRLGVECCWLKLTLIKKALLSGYRTVLFLDADTFVKPNCPNLSKVIKVDKYIYMAKGYSGRFNSGVLLVRNNIKTLSWLDSVINARDKCVEKENDVGWGENGHIIEYSKEVTFIGELSNKWNNTFDHGLNDYIRHSNCGPMRTNYMTNLFHKVVFYFSARMMSITIKVQRIFQITPKKNLLFTETRKILSIYPTITNS